MAWQTSYSSTPPTSPSSTIIFTWGETKRGRVVRRSTRSSSPGGRRRGRGWSGGQPDHLHLGGDEEGEGGQEVNQIIFTWGETKRERVVRRSTRSSSPGGETEGGQEVNQIIFTWGETERERVVRRSTRSSSPGGRRRGRGWSGGQPDHLHLGGDEEGQHFSRIVFTRGMEGEDDGQTQSRPMSNSVAYN